VQPYLDITVDDALLKKRCPSDNDQYVCMSVLPPVRLSVIIEILLQPNIPSLTRFRSLSHRAMQLVNLVRQYTAIIKHCHIIHAIVSIQADAFDCATLYRALFTTQFPLPDTGWQEIS